MTKNVRLLTKKARVQPTVAGGKASFTVTAAEYLEASMKGYQRMVSLCNQRYPEDIPVLLIPDSLPEMNIIMNTE